MSPVMPVLRRYPSIALLVILALLSSSVAAPHGSTEPVGRSKRGTAAQLENAAPPTFSYVYEEDRVGHCKDDKALFSDCYLCGKITDSREIYIGCCEKQPTFLDFCIRLLV